jgi:hypothetical protein
MKGGQASSTVSLKFVVNRSVARYFNAPSFPHKEFTMYYVGIDKAPPADPKAKK